MTTQLREVEFMQARADLEGGEGKLLTHPNFLHNGKKLRKLVISHIQYIDFD